MTAYWLPALLLGLAVQGVLAQETRLSSMEPWQVDAQIGIAARALAPPAPSQHRNIARHSVLSPALQDLLSQASGSVERDALPVRIHLIDATQATSKRVGDRVSERVNERIMSLGGEVETALGEVIYASLSADALARLAATKGIRLIEPQATFVAQTNADATPSQSDGAHAAMLVTLATLHDQGLRGKGVRVGVLDFSFAGYPALLAAKQLPPVFAQRAFAGKQSVADSDKLGVGHGTACARIIHALAPDAELVIASVGEGRDTTEGRVLAAAQWLAAQGASIINFSGSGYVSPLDGSAPLDQLIDQLVARGSTWIVAAGNQAQLHWQGRITDDNHNGWIDPGTGAESRPYGDLFAVEMMRAGPVTFTLNWGPWTGQASDLDIFLYRAAADGKLVQIAQSDSVQAAGKAGGLHPVEIIQTALEPGYYFIGIRATRLLGKGTVHLFVSGAKRMTPVVEAGSVGSPGTSKMAVTVGAANAISMLAEAYSGRGPTSDGRRKPELLASGEMLRIDGATSFRGTSAAAPMVSGLAALMAPASGTALRERLQQLARPSPSDKAEQTAAWGTLTPELLLTRR